MPYGEPKRDNYSKEQYPRLLLRAARRNKNLSIRELADLAGISRGYIGACEKGTCNLSVKAARKLAAVLMVANWWDLCENFKYIEGEESIQFIGNNGTTFRVEKN